jgi:hypothetical protein
MRLASPSLTGRWQWFSRPFDPILNLEIFLETLLRADPMSCIGQASKIDSDAFYEVVFLDDMG